MGTNKSGCSFHTDQGRWEDRDFLEDEFSLLENDNELRDDPFPVVEDSFHKPTGHMHSDAELTELVKSVLRGSHYVDGDHIQVLVKNGDVELKGFCYSEAEKIAAGDLPHLIHGVGEVHNHLKVTPLLA